MNDPDYLAHVKGAGDPSQRPHRTLGGALASVVLVFALVLAAAEPVLVFVTVTALLVGVFGARRVLASRRSGHSGRRRTDRSSRHRGAQEFCLPGTSVCVRF